MNKHFFNKETANYATGSQGCNVFALKLGIVPEEYAQKVADNIAADVIKEDYHLTTGNIATKYLPEVLSEYGYSDIAMRLMEQTTYPSWGYMRSMGATTIWERWEYATGFAMNSHSHPMYGSVTAWFYKYLAGISAAEAGFKKIKIRPYMPSSLTFQGVSKSGSPTPSDIASGISLTTSKNFLIPEGSISTIFLDKASLMVLLTSFHPCLLHQLQFHNLCISLIQNVLMC